MIGLGIVGIGGYGQSYVNTISCLKGLCTLEAVVVQSPEQDRKELEALRADRPEVRVYSSVTELLDAERGVGLLCIPTGIPSHFEYASLCLNKGVHVLCEKPVTGSYEEALALAELRRKSGLVLTVGFQNIFTPSIQRIKALILGGSLGALQELRGIVSWQRNRDYFRRNGWSGRIYSNGTFVFDSPLQNAASHVLQNLLYLAGDTPGETAQPVKVYGENYRAYNIESADTQFIRVRCSSGAVINMGAALTAGESRSPGMRILLEKGEILWDMKEGRTRVTDSGGEVLEEFANEGENPKELVFKDTIRAIEEKDIPLCSVDNSLAHTLCLSSLYRAMPDIRQIPASDSAGGSLLTVPEAAPALDRLLQTGESFFEQNISWAAEGREVEVEP
ncbi:MAG: Gfo/Idh/MocA family oxidoreductase [Spirochaetales bacterium]|nr:Gfo/Idh/MocA family oxidoreductase [Spirochaetales bacterium]